MDGLNNLSKPDTFLGGFNYLHASLMVLTKE